MNFDFLSNITMQYYIAVAADDIWSPSNIELEIRVIQKFVKTIEGIRITRANEKLMYVSRMNHHSDTSSCWKVKIQKIIQMSEHPEYESICLRSVSNNGTILQYISAEWQTTNICRAAIQRSYIALQYVEQQTAEMCYIAVRHCGRSLQYVKPLFQTRELCLLAVINDACALLFVPAELMTRDLCLRAVSRFGRALRYVPAEFKTYEICTTAVSQSPDAVQYIHVKDES